MITDPWYVYHKLIVQFDKTSLRGFLGVFGAFILLVPALVPLGPGLVTVCFSACSSMRGSATRQ